MLDRTLLWANYCTAKLCDLPEKMQENIINEMWNALNMPACVKRTKFEDSVRRGRLTDINEYIPVYPHIYPILQAGGGIS